MGRFIVSGNTWPSYCYKQFNEFVLSFQTQDEAKAAHAALHALGQNIYVAPLKFNQVQQGISNAVSA